MSGFAKLQLLLVFSVVLLTVLTVFVAIGVGVLIAILRRLEANDEARHGLTRVGENGREVFDPLLRRGSRMRDPGTVTKA